MLLGLLNSKWLCLWVLLTTLSPWCIVYWLRLIVLEFLRDLCWVYHRSKILNWVEHKSNCILLWYHNLFQVLLLLLTILSKVFHFSLKLIHFGQKRLNQLIFLLPELCVQAINLCFNFQFDATDVPSHEVTFIEFYVSKKLVKLCAYLFFLYNVFFICKDRLALFFTFGRV